MDELTSTVRFEEFGVEPRVETRETDTSLGQFGTDSTAGGGEAGFRLAMVKTREAFLDLFERARHVDAITYAETPALMVRMLTDYDIESLDVLIGNAEDYAGQVTDVDTARSLVDLREQGRLTVRLKNQKTIHSKMYRIVMPDETVKLVHGSANLSVNSWEYHTNQISVLTTTVGTTLDKKFEQFIQEYRDRYSSQTLLEGIVEAVGETESEAEREERLKYWVGTGELDVSDTAALNQDATADIKDVADKLTAVVTDPDEADETVAFVDGTDAATQGGLTAQSDAVETGPGEKPESGSESEPEPEETVDTPVESDPDVGLVESDHETAVTETLDRPRVRATDEQIRIGTSRVDAATADEFGSSLRDRGATVEDHSITASVSAYQNQVKESIDIPSMSVVPETEQVVLGEGDDLILVATEPPTPAVLDHCLETIEQYVETVQTHGHTETPTAVMAQMYEAFLYGFWAPFANQYAEALSSPSRTLNNVLQHLYIEGKSDAGKDKLVEYILRLLSDNTVVSGVDADEVGIGEIRGVREWDTCFPYAVIDAEKKKIQNWSPIRNYWGDWTPTSVDQPCLIFTTNDALPKSEFRNRMKILSMDVSFPSKAEDPGFERAQADLSAVLERQNPIFSYVARRMVIDTPWQDGTGTVEDVRAIFRAFYEQADRTPPAYFPADEPAEKLYDTGRIKWQRDIQGGRVTFDAEPGAITANFERDGYAVHRFEKQLPKRMMSDKSGTSVYIGAPDVFAEWIGHSVEDLLSGAAEDTAGSWRDSPDETGQEETPSDGDDESGGLFSRFLGR